MDGYNTRDLDYELISPDFEWTTAMAGVDNEVMRGREGIDNYYASLDAAWEHVRIFGGEFRDLRDRVLVLGRIEGRGRGSGVPVDAPYAAIVDFRDGKTWRARGYLDHSEALRAAGLE
jgi:ketosteroid isomerase-like protein